MLFELKKGLSALLPGFILLTILSCSRSIPNKNDFPGLYNIIKIRENGKILNIGTLSQIELTEELYISGIDKNSDNQISEDERTSVSYSFQLDEKNNPYLKINDIDVRIELLSDINFDLILKRIDPLGNETILYLKK